VSNIGLVRELLWRTFADPDTSASIIGADDGSGEYPDLRPNQTPDPLVADLLWDGPALCRVSIMAGRNNGFYRRRERAVSAVLA